MGDGCRLWRGAVRVVATSGLIAHDGAMDSRGLLGGLGHGACALASLGSCLHLHAGDGLLHTPLPSRIDLNAAHDDSKQALLLIELSLRSSRGEDVVGAEG